MQSDRIGPVWAHVNPYGVRYVAWCGIDVRILQIAAQSTATTRRAEQIREETGIAWELACLQAERERDAAKS